MLPTSVLLCAAVLGIVAARISSADHVDTAPQRLPCSAALNAAECAAHGKRCAWCGNGTESYPIGQCYDASNKELSCCTFPFDMPCGPTCCPQAQICNATNPLCQTTSGGSDWCVLSLCCPQDRPVPCGQQCLQSGESCCDGGLICPQNTSCCGTGPSATCCGNDEPAKCCSSADGNAYFCCHRDQACAAESGTCCAPQNLCGSVCMDPTHEQCCGSYTCRNDQSCCGQGMCCGGGEMCCTSIPGMHPVQHWCGFACPGDV